jgi:hypothetical protein
LSIDPSANSQKKYSLTPCEIRKKPKKTFFFRNLLMST